jgi:hypothetical protein
VCDRNAAVAHYPQVAFTAFGSTRERASSSPRRAAESTSKRITEDIMINRRASFILGAIVFASLSGLSFSCSSTGGEGDETGGGVQSGGAGGDTGGEGGTGNGGSGTGGSAGSTGGSGTGGSGTGGSGVGGTSGACPDPITGNCNTTCAKTDAVCNEDCDVVCGYNGIGTKHCTCQGGVYIECPCPRPAAFLGPTRAPYCDVKLGGDGMMASYDETDCTVEWEACISRDQHTGTPRGCVCMQDPDADFALKWSCGSTNKWFAAE